MEENIIQPEIEEKVNKLVDELFAGKYMTATMEQNRKAMELIRNIIEALGPISPVATAFDRCLEIAESNIQNCSLGSMKRLLDKSDSELKALRDRVSRDRKKIERLTCQNSYLSQRLEEEEEWTDYEDPGCVSDKEYNMLLFSEMKTLNPKNAKLLISILFQYDLARIEIIRESPKLQKNRHGQIRIKGMKARNPLYYSIDMNYVRFNFAGKEYELYNGNLYMLK